MNHRDLAVGGARRSRRSLWWDISAAEQNASGCRGRPTERDPGDAIDPGLYELRWAIYEAAAVRTRLGAARVRPPPLAATHCASKMSFTCSRRGPRIRLAHSFRVPPLFLVLIVLVAREDSLFEASAPIFDPPF